MIEVKWSDWDPKPDVPGGLGEELLLRDAPKGNADLVRERVFFYSYGAARLRDSVTSEVNAMRERERRAEWSAEIAESGRKSDARKANAVQRRLEDALTHVEIDLAIARGMIR